MEIPARDAVPADIQFAGHAAGHGLPLLIQDVELRVVNRPPDRHRARDVFIEGNFVDAAAYDRLRGAVFVDEAGFRRARLPDGEALAPQRLPADDERPCASGHVVLRHELAQDVEVRRGQFDQAEVARAAQRLTERLAAGRFGQQRDAASCQERRKQAGDRQVEAQRAVNRRALPGSHVVGAGAPLHIVVESPVRHHHPFGSSGGAGGVDDVGQVVRRDRISGIIRAFLGDHRPVAIQTEGVNGRRDQVLDKVRPGQQDSDARIVQHEGRARRRIRGIERQIGRPGLQRAEQPDDGLRCAFHVEADHRFGAGAQSAQIARQLVGARVDVAVRESPLPLNHGDGVGRLPRLKLEPVMDAVIGAIIDSGIIPGHEKLLHLGRSQQGKRGDPSVGGRHGALQQHCKVSRHTANRVRLEQIGVVLKISFQPRVRFLKSERQVENGRAAVHGAVGGPDSRQVQREVAGIVKHEHHLEQRVAAQIALRLQRLDQPLEGQILVLVGFERALADPFQHQAEGRIAGEVAAQRQRVDEEADQPFHLAARAVGDGRADEHIRLSRVAVEQHLKDRQQQHEERDAFALRERLRIGVQCAGEREVIQRAVVGLDEGARPVGGQLQDRQRAAETLLPIRELTL